MSRFPAVLLGLAVLVASPLAAQGRMGRGAPPPDHWVTADSLAIVVGLTDRAVIDQLAPHLAGVDKVLKSAADERQKMMAARQQGGGPPDPATMQVMREKMQGFEAALSSHYQAIRGLLTPEQQGRFDALQKPALQPMRRMGGPGAAAPPQ